MDGARIAREFFVPLPSAIADLFELALAVYAADRLSRRSYCQPDTGQRKIHVRISVTDTGLWSSLEMERKLKEYLYWVSGDDWSFDFTNQQGQLSERESERYLFCSQPKPPVHAALFSGGLDSLAGIVGSLLARPDDSPVLVSGFTHSQLLHQQKSLTARIREAIFNEATGSRSTEIHHVAIPFGVRQPSNGPRRPEESTQRTRGFAFLAFGVGVALQAGSNTLHVYENGIGALNLPLNGTQLGVDNYRGVHPRSLMMASEIIELALGRSVNIVNPALFKTKAQLCESLNNPSFEPLISSTVSCDSFPIRTKNSALNCGNCTSCVLRRASLAAAHLSRFDSAKGYLYDIFNDQGKRFKSAPNGLAIMQGQANKFSQCLASPNSWSALIQSFPELARTQFELSKKLEFSPFRVRQLLVGVIERFVQEWNNLP